MKLKLLIIIVCFIFILCNSFAQGTGCLNDFRYSLDSDKIRLVFDLSDKTDYLLYRQGDPEIFTVSMSGISLKGDMKKQLNFDDPLLHSTTFVDKGDGSIQAQIRLRYAIPWDKYKISLIENPYRLVFDLERNFQEKNVTVLTPGVVWTKVIKSSKNGVLTVNYVTIDLTKENLQVKAIQAKDNNKGRETTSSMSLRSGALIAINGGFYDIYGGPLGLTIINGKLEGIPVSYRPPRSAFGITYDKKILIDRVDYKNNILKALSGQDWSGVAYAIGAGPNLVTDGNVNITDKEEELGPGGNDVTRGTDHTVIGVTNDNKIILFTVDDKNPDTGAVTMNLRQVAEYLVSIGVKDAVNMDGSDSVAMLVQGKMINNTYGPERKVANAWIVLNNGGQMTAPYNIKVEQKDYRQEKGNFIYKIETTITDINGNTVEDGTGIRFKSSYGITEPSFTTTKDGKAILTYSSMKAGKGKLVIQTGTIELEVLAEFK